VDALNNTDQIVVASESLPFRVEIACRQNLMEVANLRAATYGKHLPALVETTRLCVKGSPNASVVRSALFKALHQYCLMQKVDWMIAAGRRPVDRIYDSLLFSDVDKQGEFYPMAHAGGLPHRVMCLSPVSAHTAWRECKHPLHKFVVETLHPDIDLSQAHNLNFAWDCPDTGSTVIHLPERRHTPRTSNHWPSHPLSLAA
jgi:hypothetical protein